MSDPMLGRVGSRDTVSSKIGQIQLKKFKSYVMCASASTPTRTAAESGVSRLIGHGQSEWNLANYFTVSSISDTISYVQGSLRRVSLSDLSVCPNAGSRTRWPMRITSVQQCTLCMYLNHTTPPTTSS